MASRPGDGESADRGGPAAWLTPSGRRDRFRDPATVQQGGAERDTTPDIAPLGCTGERRHRAGGEGEGPHGMSARGKCAAVGESEGCEGLCGLGGVRRGRSFPGWMLLAMVLAMLAGNAGACTLCNTTLSFSVPKAGRATGITVEFRYTHIFEREDTVTVHLPGFTRQAGSTGTSLLSTTTTNALGLSAFSTASWDQEAEILVLSHLLPVVIPADTLLAVTVGAGANIRLPALGVPAAAPSIEIKADTGKPPYNVPFAPFARIPPVGESRPHNL
ncbi:hypothetical protein T484DRAFT_1787298 [Baffinella frigidus]|nr:hypothetical protein T484DRAFT_1787298 [Cryptophyta sp. CCMP2293]